MSCKTEENRQKHDPNSKKRSPTRRFPRENAHICTRFLLQAFQSIERTFK